ncbi:MAG: iron ABC transporter permease [Proteobacteria bacterium]|nr:iron ABC transporter permease [Pseudomonadota bacterium]
MSGALSRTRVLLICLGLLALLAMVILVGLCVGSEFLSPLRLMEALLGGRPLDPAWHDVVFALRLPRLLLAALAGFGLALGGVIFQALLRNPLADPYVLGVSSGAAAGAVLVLSLGLTAGFWVTSAAFGGAILSLVLVLAVASPGRRLGPQTIILAGVIVAALGAAVVMMLISLSPSHRAHNIMFWLFGDLSAAGYARVAFVAPVVLLAGLLLYPVAHDLNLMAAGEETAAHLGVSVERIKWLLLVGVSVLIGVIVSVSGIIGFVGLVVPHLARMMTGPDHRLLIPAAALGGASFLAAADTLARVVIAPVELPVGVIMAFVGAPFFLFLLTRRRA